VTIHYLNCFTSHARVPAHWHTGALCLVIETNQGLVLVDTGLGQDDYVHRTGIIRMFQIVTIVPLDPEEAVIYQIARLGYAPADVRHIVLTHMHFDHCGGLPDFPQAKVHVHRREYQAFTGYTRHWIELAYVRRHIAHRPEFALYEHTGDTWFDLPAIRLPFEPQMFLVPLFGHTRGHCGVAVENISGWLFHVGDAAPIDFNEQAPDWLVRFVMGPHSPMLQAFKAAHPEVHMTTGHMWLDFFEVG
jgi:glyoxylase-like metal-dependent hydrolase (beta-lactamase superfamily II)